jgi:hypothetical protein
MSTTADGAAAEAHEAFQNLTPDQLTEILALLPGADSVELKLTVPDTHRRTTVNGLGMDLMDGQLRQVVFFDTPELTLNKAGLVVRARRVQRKPGDSVVKLRPVVPDQLPASLRKSPEFGVEVDAMPGGFVCSGRMKHPAEDALLKQVFLGQKPVHKLFSKQQRALYEAHAPDGIGLDDLSVLGPINVLKLKFEPEGFPRRMVAEAWFYPDGSLILELSTKCAPGEAFQTVAESRAFLGQKGVDLGAPQQTKTKTALEFFAAELSGATSS